MRRLLHGWYPMNLRIILPVAVAVLYNPCSASAADSVVRSQKKAAKPPQFAGEKSSVKKRPPLSERPAGSSGRPHRSPRNTGAARDLRSLEITAVTLTAREGWLGAGSVIGVKLSGTPAAEAFFDIPGFAHGVKMREDSAGNYSAEYKLPINRNVCLESAAVLACLREGDQFSPPTAAARQLKIDASPPVIEQVYPRPSAKVVRMRVPILAQLTDQSGSGLAVERARLLLDEHDVSDFLVISNGCAAYQPTIDLEPGEHSVHLMVYDRAGNMKSQSWAFTVVDSQYSIRSVVTNADRIMDSGDTLTANVEGMWGGKVTLLIGDKEIALKEQSPGFYEGSYVFRKGDTAGSAPLAIRFTSSENNQYFETLEQPLRMVVTEPTAPTITQPVPAAWSSDQLVVRGKGSPRSTVRLRIAYRLPQGRMHISGIVAEQHIRVGADGLWEGKPIERSPLLARAAAQYEMTISPSGTSESQ